ncbi:uncharacterized protein LOC132719750 [Ruditapes philippinarum]|uniref:uncharacterized protein LOC132719750 n=1 Tax=Ruditapes philippinarum TaxID=129788 RepID=UPI00295B5B46|nr:uncharacterized protein LOC132719750 [Ruditapes philippinarum]
MLNLRSAGKQKNLKEHFLLDLKINIIAKNGEKNAEGNQRVYKVMRDFIKNNDDMTGSPFYESSTDTPVYRFVDFIKAIKKCHIVDISPTYQSSIDILINCPSSKAMEDFLKSIISNEFQQELFDLRRWLQVQYNIESNDIIASCSSNGIDKAKQRLHFTDVTRTMTCAEHQNTQCTLYCPDHDTFLCTACRESKHGTCHGIKQLMSELSLVEQKRRLAIKKCKGSYSVRIDNTLFKRDSKDTFGCNISCMCMLLNGEVLLADFTHKRLKKLDSWYKVISCTDVIVHPYSVCYIGNDIAVAGLKGNSIQYVNVSGHIKLTQLVKLDHECFSLAYHDGTLYVSSADTLYKYDKYCKQKHIICPKELHMSNIYTIAISDNGERLYIRTHNGLTSLDAKGNHIFSSQLDGNRCHDMCIAGEGIVLILALTNNVHQLDYNGKLKFGTVNAVPFGISIQSMCFDRERCRLIVGGNEDIIRVYNCEFLPK